MLSATLLEEIHSLKESMIELQASFLNWNRTMMCLEEKIELNSSDVLRLLGISRASLARWRQSRLSLTVMFPAIMWSILSKDCTLQSRRDVLPSKVFAGWKPFKGLNAYKDGILKGIWETPQILFEELWTLRKKLEHTNRGTGNLLFLYADWFGSKRNFRNPLYEDRRASWYLFWHEDRSAIRMKDFSVTKCIPGIAFGLQPHVRLGYADETLWGYWDDYQWPLNLNIPLLVPRIGERKASRMLSGHSS